jgi:hypothetical protein
MKQDMTPYPCIPFSHVRHMDVWDMWVACVRYMLYRCPFMDMYITCVEHMLLMCCCMSDAWDRKIAKKKQFLGFCLVFKGNAWPNNQSPFKYGGRNSVEASLSLRFLAFGASKICI